MPTYEYYCESCKAELEIFHSMTEDARSECPECGEQAMIRRISAGGGVLFKGSGFYETDYRSDSYKKDAAAAKKDTSSKKKDSAKGSDSKPSDSSSSTD